MTKKTLKIILPAIMAFCIFFISCSALLVYSDTNKDQGQVSIVFTHDIHSRLDEYKTKKGKLVGGAARLKTAIDEIKAKNPATFLVDGGDFSMGTLYQTIYETEAPEITMLGRLGYDAVTLGNHEFDYRAQGIANMLNQATQKAKEDDTLSLPRLVSANIDWKKNNSADNKLIKEAMDNYGSTSYIIVERGGVKVGIYGVLGEVAESNAPESGLTFDSIVDTSKKVVKQLQNENVDMIICLSHSGTNDNIKKSEDEILAKKVPEIDIIVSSHTHTTLNEPIVHGDTTIVSSGCYGENLGVLDVIPTKDGRWTVEDYNLEEMSSDIKQDSAVLNELDRYKNIINETYLKGFGLTAEQILADNRIAFTQMDSFAQTVEEDPLGSLIADSYIYAVEQAEKGEYRRVDVAVVPSGVIRDTFQKGTISVAEAFNVSALGIGPDRKSGYPLVSVFLTGAELKTMAEIDVSVSTLMPEAQLYASGMEWAFNPNRLILNRVTDTKIAGETIDDKKLYRVVSGLYSAQMLGAVEDQSKGILKVTPKDEEGNVITDFEKHIIHDEEEQELKEWYALASYISSFQPNDEGLAQVPEEYGELQGRKQMQDTKNIIELIRSPNKIAICLYVIIIVTILLIALFVRKIVKKSSKR